MSQEPPLLQNPERVVRHSESEHFERSFQPNVALAPRRLTQPPPMPSSVVGRPRSREHEKERDQKNEKRLSPLRVKIKQERPSTPLEDEPMYNNDLHERFQDDDMLTHQSRLISSPIIRKTTPSPLPHQQFHDSSHIVLQQPVMDHAAPPNPSLKDPPPSLQNSPSPPIASPEGHSGSNEITSSTSPVPATNSSKRHRTSSTIPTDRRDSISDGESTSTKNQTKLILKENHHQHHHHTHKNVTNTTNNESAGHGINITTNSELELSTDTDDDSLVGEPDSSNNNPAWDSTVEALKDTAAPDRDRVLQVVKQLLADNASYASECCRLRQELRRRDDQIADLKLGPTSSSDEGSASNDAKTTDMGFAFCEPKQLQQLDVIASTITKAVADVIRMPLKKSLRCSLDADHTTVRSTTNMTINGSSSDGAAPAIKTDG